MFSDRSHNIAQSELPKQDITRQYELTMIMDIFLNKITCGDSLSLLPPLPDASADVVVVSPFYFLDKLDDEWSQTKTPRRRKSQLVVKSFLAGTKSQRLEDRRNGSG